MEKRKPEKPQRSQYRDLRGAGWNRWNDIEKLPATLDGERPQLPPFTSPGSLEPVEISESEYRALWGDR